MNFDDLRNNWELYDQKLSKNIEINENLLKNFNLNKAEDKLKKPYNFELTNLIMGTGCLIFFIVQTIIHANNFGIMLTGITSCILFSFFTILSYIKVIKFSKIDYYNSSIFESQQKIAELNSLVLKYRKYELTLIPLLVISLIPIFSISLTGRDIFQHLNEFIIHGVICTIIAYPLCLLINKYIYDKKIKAAQKFLEKIQEFEKEN
jgi:hypothetical protein